MIDRDELNELVGIFYPSPYKIFYINSSDGESFEKPFGTFISLGLTTSPRIMESIRDIISSSEIGKKAEIREIASKKLYGQFLNYLTDSIPSQYELTTFPEGVMNEVESKNLLENLQELISDDQQIDSLRETIPKVTKLKAIIEKLEAIDNAWERHSIYLDEIGDFKIYHKYVNYEKDGDIEYRIGIFVKSH